MKRIDFYRVHSREGLEKAAELVQSEYEQDGYVPPLAPESAAPVSAFVTQPSSSTFVAQCGDIVVGTVSMIRDGEIGFPLDDIFKAEMDRLRTGGKRCVEISQLAVRRDADEVLGISSRNVQLSVLLPLFRLIFYGARACGTDLLCVTINPKHDSFYRAVGFESVGETKPYDTVGGAPALLRVFDMERAMGMPGNFVMRGVLDNPISTDAFDSESDAPILSLEV